jgi:acyl-coenzyme A thioesterase PaaI-like protein
VVYRNGYEHHRIAKIRSLMSVVPNGGYVTGCILEVVKTHFSTSLANQNQPHTIALHIEFLRRTQIGPAIFKVDNIKLGRQTSIVHVSMEQEGRQEVVAYVTNSNMDTETGFTFDTEHTLSPPMPSVDLSKLEQDSDPIWARQKEMPHAKFRKATNRVHFHLPRAGQSTPASADEWLCFSDGSNFTNTSIGFVADMFPLLIERFRHKEQGPFWYPTLLLNLDIKKSLPPGGVKWLQIRVEMKKVQRGRMDLEVFVHDSEGDLVALSHHVGFVMDASRNTAARRKTDAKI